MDISGIGYIMRIHQIGVGLVSRALGPLNFAVVVLTYLKVRGINVPVVLGVAIFIMIILLMFLAGYIYDRLGIYEAEISFDMERNRMIRELRDRRG